MISRPRPAEETERAHGPPEFRAWMKTRQCIACGRRGCDAAHIHSGGTGRKDDWTRTVPLCFSRFDRTGRVGGCHSLYDDAKQTFPIERGLDMEAEARENHARWLAHAATLEALPW